MAVVLRLNRRDNLNLHVVNVGCGVEAQVVAPASGRLNILDIALPTCVVTNIQKIGHFGAIWKKLVK